MSAIQTIKLRRTNDQGKDASSAGLDLGEMAMNTRDGFIWTPQDTTGDGNGDTLISVLTENNSIQKLSDVYTDAVPLDGQVLTYDTTNGWQPETNASVDWSVSQGGDPIIHLDNYVQYSPPSYTARNLNVDTTTMTGAWVISDLDFDVTSNTLGHITDATLNTLTKRELNITDMKDVFSSMSPADGQVLTFDDTNGWQAEATQGTLTGGESITINTNAIDLDASIEVDSIVSRVTDGDLSISAGTGNVVIDNVSFVGTVPTDGQLLTFDDTNGWQPETAATLAITDLTDVYDSMSPTDGQILTFDDTNGWQAENNTVVPPERGGLLWDNTINYLIGDSVTFETDKTYIALVDNIDIEPASDTITWVLASSDTIYTDNFDGFADQTEFVLMQSHDINRYIEVCINGIQVRDTQFSTDGDKITLTKPVAENDWVKVTIFNAEKDIGAIQYSFDELSTEE